MFQTHYRSTLTATALCAFAAVSAAQSAQVGFSEKPPTGSNTFTVGNRAPLLPSAFRKLPLGAITPEGWIRKQLLLETEGFTGRLGEISPWLEKKDNAWISPTGAGKNGWEEVPYWLKGFGDLGYVLNNKRIIDDTKVWIEGVLSSSRPNGYFGPESNLTANNGKPDVWPNMVMLNALQSYYEYSHDSRVLKLMSGYFKWMLTIPDPDFLLSYWEPQRVGDNIASIYWLYNRTGDKSLFDAVEKLHRRGAKWSQGVPDWHGVNMAQGFREPAEYYVLNHDAKFENATESDYEMMRRMYGQVPGGLYGADENARKGFSDPRQAAETCTMVEMMWSDEMLLTMTGNPVWAERCEDVAFNSLPASMTPDLKALHYLTSPNMILVDKGSKAPGLQNSGPMLLFNAYDHRCCQHNASHGWPYYAEHLWLATADNGLAAVLYGPSKVTMKAGNGTPVTITEDTQYPFDETVRFKFSTSKPNKFAFTLRWPSWCKKPQLLINHRPLSITGEPGGYLSVNRTWKTGDALELKLPMTVRLKPEFHGSESVERGPLTYSLKIGEKYVRMGGTSKFPAYEVHPTTAWNYGLVAHPTFAVVKKAFPASGQPFTPDSTPIEIRTQAKRIPGWKSDRLGLVGLLQDMPAKSSEPTETVTLVPMGAARLRITAFPTVSEATDAHTWAPPAKPKPAVPASASHVFGGDTVDAPSQGYLPKSSGDESNPRFTWWDRKGSLEWFEYDFKSTKTVSRSSIYWFDDRGNGGCRVPASWRLLAEVNGEWKEVSATDPYGVEMDKFNMVGFTPVASKKFRVEVQLQEGFSGGILAWNLK